MTQAWDFVDASVLWQTRDSFLSRHVDDIKWYGKRLDVRISNCLRNDGIQTVGDLVERTEIELLRNPNFGLKSLNAIKRVLSEHHLELKPWPYR